MARPTPRELRRRLRRLDADALARFVAALWAASGWSTAVRDGRVVARRHDPRTERRDLAVVAGHADVARTLARVPDEADALVTPVGDREARLLAARSDLRVVDAEALQERLTYGVDADVREHLLAEHVPDGEPLVGRRSVLSAVALGAGVFGGGALAPAGGPDVATDAEVWYDLGGPTPGAPGLGDPDDEHAPEEPPGDGGTPTTTGPDGGTAPSDRRTPTPVTDCESDPRRALAAQLTTFRREVAVHDDLDLVAERSVGYDVGEAIEALVAALNELGYEPFRNAEDVDVGEPRESTAGPVLPVAVVTGDDTVGYEFTMTRTPGGCWLAESAELVDTTGSR